MVMVQGVAGDWRERGSGSVGEVGAADGSCVAVFVGGGGVLLMFAWLKGGGVLESWCLAWSLLSRGKGRSGCLLAVAQRELKPQGLGGDRLGRQTGSTDLRDGRRENDDATQNTAQPPPFISTNTNFPMITPPLGDWIGPCLISIGCQHNPLTYSNRS